VQAGMFRSTGTLLRLPGVLRSIITGSIAVSSVEVIQTYWPALGHERSFSAAIVSTMLVVRAIMSVASRGALGQLARRFGRRHLMIGSLSLSAIALAGIAIPAPPAVLILCAGVFGFSIGICQPLTMSWLTEITPPGNRGMTMSLRLAGNRISQAAIPVTLGTLVAATGVGGVLVASGLALAVSALIVRGGRTARAPATSEPQ
ncbi:MAG TPA: MFS transporter, partial [Galbitalea sp.]|nr:MFS transporter [Galbitalea sp.]